MAEGRRRSTSLAVLLTGVLISQTLLAAGDSDEPSGQSVKNRQIEAIVIGFFGASGALSPGARLGFEWRPWEEFGAATGATFLTTSTDEPSGAVSGRRYAGEVAGTVHHAADSITSSAAFGLRMGWVRFSSDGADGIDLTTPYAQLLFRGRGEWSFSEAFYLLFQMELAFAIKSAEARMEGAVVDDVRGLEADLGFGIGFRF